MIVLLIKFCSDNVEDDEFSHNEEIMVIEEYYTGHKVVLEHHPEQVVVEHAF